MADDRAESAVERYKRLRAERLAGPTRFLEPAQALAVDMLWRGLTRDGELRVLVARTTNLARDVARRHACTADAAALLAELLTASLLVRSTLDPDGQLQVTIENHGSAGRLTVDVWRGESGLRASIARARVTLPEHGPLLGEGILQITRSRARREPYRSATELDAAGIDRTLMRYLLESEQIPAVLRLGVALRDGEIEQAAGVLIQVTPEGTREDLARVVSNLDALPPLASAMTPADPDARGWALGLLDGFRWDQCARETVSFACRCSRERVLAILGALPPAELAEIVGDGQPAETVCEFCKEVYSISEHELRTLVARN
jgi:molecular chaperone Hsp33